VRPQGFPLPLAPSLPLPNLQSHWRQVLGWLHRSHGALLLGRNRTKPHREGSQTYPLYQYIFLIYISQYRNWSCWYSGLISQLQVGKKHILIILLKKRSYVTSIMWTTSVICTLKYVTLEHILLRLWPIPDWICPLWVLFFWISLVKFWYFTLVFTTDLICDGHLHQWYKRFNIAPRSDVICIICTSGRFKIIECGRYAHCFREVMQKFSLAMCKELI